MQNGKNSASPASLQQNFVQNPKGEEEVLGGESSDEDTQGRSPVQDLKVRYSKVLPVVAVVGRDLQPRFETPKQG